MPRPARNYGRARRPWTATRCTSPSRWWRRVSCLLSITPAMSGPSDLSARSSTFFGVHRSGRFARQAIGDQIGTVGTALGANQILLALMHVGHGGAGLHLVHEHRAFLLTAGLVIGAQPRAFAPLFIGEQPAIAAN